MRRSASASFSSESTSRQVNSQIIGLQRFMRTEGPNRCPLSALYFAPSKESLPEDEHVSIKELGGKGSFIVQEFSARSIPIPHPHEVEVDSPQPRIPYLLLHQYLDMDRVCRKISLIAHQRSRIHTVVHANTAGPFGINLRRIAIRRNFPIVASYHGAVYQTIESSAVQLLETMRSNMRPLNQLLTQDFFRELFPFLADEPELLGPVAELFEDVELAGKHLLKVHHPVTRHVGRVLFWLGQRLNNYVYDKVEGGKAVMRIYGNGNRLAAELISRYGLDRSFDSTQTDPAIRRTVRMLIQRYLNWFYSAAQVVFISNNEDRTRLLEMGVPEERIQYVECDSPEIVGETYRHCRRADLLRSEETATIPHVESLRDFQWKPRPDGFPTFKPFCTISDLHLADGDSFDRMEALAELYPLLDAKGVNSIVYNGDLGELSASRKKYQTHRNRVNWVRQSCLSGVPPDAIPPTATAEVSIAALSNGTIKDVLRDKIERQMIKAAGRAGLSLRINGDDIGILSSHAELPSTELGRSTRITMEEVLTYGNHDEGLVLEDEFPGIAAASSLIHFDEEMGAVFTHGHIVGLSEFLGAMSDCELSEHVTSRLKRNNLHKALQSQEVIHDIATLGWRFTERAINSRWLWKHALQPTISRWVQRLRKRRLESQPDESEDGDSQARFWESIISPADDVFRCAQLAATFHSSDTPTWVCCYGHSHVPAIEKVRVKHPQTGRLHTKIVVNSGKFHGDLMTAAIVNFPEVTIFYWSQRDKEWRMHMIDTLSDDEVAEVLDCDGSKPAPSPKLTQTTTPTNSGTVLHEVPTEGDGHITRFAALYPEYQKHGTVCTVLSGPRSAKLDLPGGVHHRCQGLRLHYTDSGGLDAVASTNAYFHQIRSVGDEARKMAPMIPNFKAIVSDFGPTVKLAYKEAQRTARANHRLNSMPELFSCSHQAALESHQENVPRPETSLTNDVQQRAIDMLRGTQSIGFHYESYNPSIFLPMIRPEIQSLSPRFDGDFVLVYLRGDIRLIATMLSQVKLSTNWRVYHRSATTVTTISEKITVHPTSRKEFTAEIPHCRGILADAGFGITSESLHLGLPLVVRPVQNHLEQQSNAAALREISHVGIINDLTSRESIQTIFETMGQGLDTYDRIVRHGIMGPIQPYEGIERKVVEKVLSLT